MKKQQKFNQQNSKLILEELEERRLFSGGIEGLIGTELVAFLEREGHDAIRLVRRDPVGDSELRWDPAA